MSKYTIKILDGNHYVFDEDKIIGQNPVVQFLDRLKVITVITDDAIRYFNTDNVVMIKEEGD